MIVRVARLGCLLSLLSFSALANDTNAVVGAGGLQFVKTDALRIEREDLTLSMDRIDVAYRIRNLTGHDIRTLIAFPLPDIDVASLSERPHAFHQSRHDGDIFDFHVLVEGREIEPRFEARAFDASGRDVTDRLRKHGIPLVSDTGPSMWAAIERVQKDPAAWRELVDAGVVYDDDVGHPAWHVTAAYRWEQLFPAGRTISVTHHYQPVLGGSPIPKPGQPGTDAIASYCPDKAFAGAMGRLPGLEESADYVNASWLEYVLKTGANWAGGIGEFRLTIDKGAASLVSLCPIPGLSLRREGRKFVARAKDFTPTEDIKVLFVQGGDPFQKPDR